MHVLITVVQAGSQARPKQLLSLSRPREEQLGGCRQQRKLHTGGLAREQVCQRLQDVRRTYSTHSTMCRESTAHKAQIYTTWQSHCNIFYQVAMSMLAGL